MADDKKNDVKKELSRLEKLKQQRAKVQQLINKEQSKGKALERKIDTRRKILAGALALSHMEKDPQHKATMERLFREGLKNNNDRELFGLPPLVLKEDK